MHEPSPLKVALDAYAEIKKVAKPSKYRNKKCAYGGAVFDSQGERDRYIDLERMQAAGLISELKRQVSFEIIPVLTIGGKRQAATNYRADFTYWEQGAFVVEDFKGHITAEYRLKKKLMRHVHGIEIRETGK